MRRFWSAAAIAAALTSVARAAPPSALPGYGPVDAAQERRLEGQFIDIPSAQSALATATAIGARPHAPGTPGDSALAVDLRDRLRAAGVDAELQPFSARVESPRKLVLELAPPADLGSGGAPGRRRGRRAAFPIGLDLADRSPRDAAAGDLRAIGLPFNAGSADGDVSAPLVYAGFGREADYTALTRAGVDVRGAVLLVRYGAEFRGRLAERAQTRGAAAVLFYNDPQDDGTARGLVAPDGPWRPAGAVERGWVGDGIRIPTLPVSAANAQILLGALRGVPGPPGWTGGLPVPYPLARGPARVHVIVKLDRRTATLWNVVAVIAGRRGDQSVLVGAPRDAAVYGVGDGSGMTTLVEMARGLSFLLGGGWRPQRTIVLAGWDGAGIGGAGLRAYVAAHETGLRRGCFAYLEAARTVTGSTFTATAATALGPALDDVSGRVPDPLAPAAAVSTGAASTLWHPLPALTDRGVSPLEPLGTPTASLAFRGPFGVADSAADTIGIADGISDPDFRLHRTAAQLYGALALRIADATGAPYRMTGYLPALRAALRSGAPAGSPRSPLRAAVERFAAAAARFDRTNPAAGDDGSGALAAVQILSGVLGRAAGDSAAPAALDAAAVDAAARALQP